MQWLRRSFITGFFVTVPLFISVAAFIWTFDVVDGLTTPLYDRLLGRRIPGLGTLSTAVAVLLVGAFAVDRGRGAEPLIAVYVPTNHLYLGDIVICERERAMFPDLTVEEGIRIFLTGGMALPPRVQGASEPTA